MPEARDRLPGRGVVELPAGYGVRHGPPAGERSATRNPALLKRAEWREQWKGHGGPTPSPLPSWCPSTTLRDVDLIVRAIERSSVRLKTESERRRKNQRSRLAPVPFTSPLTCEKPSKQSPLPALASPIRSSVVLDLTPSAGTKEKAEKDAQCAKQPSKVVLTSTQRAMLEVRDRLPGLGVVGMPQGERTATRNQALVRRSELREQRLSGHGGSSSRQRRSRPSKNPLPLWYPRTPLRDITHTIQAIERRNIRLREASDLERRKQESQNFPLAPTPLTSPSLTCGKPCEQSLHPIESDATPTTSEALQLSEEYGEGAGRNKDVFDKKLMELEEMEKAVQKKLTRMNDAVKRAKLPATSQLMSMR